jgi:alanine racemase
MHMDMILRQATQALDDAIDGYGVVRLGEALKIREKS